MENKFIDEEIEIKEIKGIKALEFKLKYIDQKIIDEPAFKIWLSLEKKEKGENGIIIYCKKCNLFFYLINEKKGKIVPQCCNEEGGFICNYCGKIYFIDSYCCTKIGIINSFKINLFQSYENWKCDVFSIMKFIPFCFFFLVYFNISNGIFISKRMKIKKEDFSSFINKEEGGVAPFLLMSSFSCILYSFIYFFNYIIFYMLYLFFLFYQWKKHRNKEILL